MKKTKMNYEAGKIPLPSEIGEGDFALNVPDNITYTKDRTNRVYPTSIMPTGFKNWVINGSFLWWQRGTLFSGTGYSADRWKLSGANTQAKSGYASGIGNHIWFHSDSSAQWDWIGQFIELPSWYSGKTMTVSYLLRYTSGYDNSDAFFWARWDDGTPFATKMGDKSLTDKWQYVTHTFTVNSDATSWGSFSLRWHGSDETTGRNYGFDLAQVQFELGAHATPFEMRPKAVEFPLCQRYYQAMGTLWAADYGASNAFIQSFLTVTMRATPTIAYTFNGLTLNSNYTTNLKLALFCNGTIGSANDIRLDAEI